MAKNDIIRYGENELSIEELNLTRGQVDTVKRASQTIVASSSRLQFLERKIAETKRKLEASEDAKLLKEFKQQRKLLKAAYRDSTNRYNGVLEAVLSDVQGLTLEEKLKNIENKALASSNN